jgi:hypothetical protein
MEHFPAPGLGVTQSAALSPTVPAGCAAQQSSGALLR